MVILVDRGEGADWGKIATSLGTCQAGWDGVGWDGMGWVGMG